MVVTMLVVQGRPKGKCLSFPAGEYLVGRGEECHLRAVSPWVSRQHCLLRVTADGVQVRDLGSSNGTLVNGSRILRERQLAPGDQLQVGPLVLQLTDPAAAPPSLKDTPAELATSDTDPPPPVEFHFLKRQD